MTSVEVDPGLRTLLEVMAAARPAPLAEMGAPAARAMYDAMADARQTPAVDHVEDRTIPGPAGDIPVRVYRPEGATGVLLWFHGGGFVLGGLDTTGSAAAGLAVGAGATVVSVDYRLAPEHPFPAAVDDCWAAAIRARDEDVALRHQLLVYPVCDSTGAARSRTTNGAGYFLTQGDMEWFEDCYLGDGDRTQPYASPAYADLTGATPAHVLTAGFDPLRDEGEAYAEALATAGVPVVDDRYPTMMHGFLQMGAVTAVAAEAMARAGRHLAGALR